MTITIGILRGGPSNESPVSVKTGKSVIDGLSDKYLVHDILLSKNGEWFLNGKLSDHEKVFQSVDVVFNALHGFYGEDGKVQQLMDHFGVPYTGSNSVASSVAMNKSLSRKIFEQAGIKIPLGFSLRENEITTDSIMQIFKKIGPSLIIKPASSGSSHGISIIHNFNDLILAIENAFKYSNSVVIEEYIKGREATCGIIDNFREQEHYALPVVEIIPPLKNKFYDYSAKYNGETNELCPASFDIKIKREIENIARKCHQALGCRHYSRTDFIISKRGIYVLETNTLPCLTKETLFPKSIETIGLSYSDFLDHVISIALKRK